MKNTLFATIALAVATMPLTFAAQAPKAASPAGTSSNVSTAASTSKTKATKKSTKTHKSTKGAAVKTNKPAPTTVAKSGK